MKRSTRYYHTHCFLIWVAGAIWKIADGLDRVALRVEALGMDYYERGYELYREEIAE